MTSQPPLVYVPGLPDWPVDVQVTGSVWREGSPTPFLWKPNTDAALLVVEAVNEYEREALAGDAE